MTPVLYATVVLLGLQVRGALVHALVHLSAHNAKRPKIGRTAFRAQAIEVIKEFRLSDG
jgi:hypothetical protein